MANAVEMRRKTAIAQEAKIPPPVIPTISWLDYQLNEIHEQIAIAASNGASSINYVVFRPSDSGGVGWRELAKPMPLLMRIGADFLPWVGVHFYDDPKTLRGDAKILYDRLRADGYVVKLHDGDYEISW